MTLLILSDSHGRPDRIREAIDRVRPDGILFAGDGLRDLSYCDIPCPLWAVSGNCDWLTSPVIVGGAILEPEAETVITVEGIRLLLIHGHRYGVKGGLGQAAARGAQVNADAVIFGHTHTPVELHLRPNGESDGITAEKPLILFNPGSLGDRSASFGTLTVRGGQCLFGHGNL